MAYVLICSRQTHYFNRVFTAYYGGQEYDAMFSFADQAGALNLFLVMDKAP